MAVVDYNRSFSFLLGLLISYIFYLIYNERKCICICEPEN